MVNLGRRNVSLSLHTAMFDINQELISKARSILLERKNIFWVIGGACTGAGDGKIYFVGAIEEKDETRVIGKVGRRWPFSMGLVSYDPHPD